MNEKTNVPLLVSLVILAVIAFLFGLVMMDFFAISCTAFACYLGAVIKAIIAAGVVGVAFAAVLYVKVVPRSGAMNEREQEQPEQSYAGDGLSGEEVLAGISVPVTMYDNAIPEGAAQCPNCHEVFYSPFDKAFIANVGKCYDCVPETVAAHLAKKYGLLDGGTDEQG